MLDAATDSMKRLEALPQPASTVKSVEVLDPDLRFPQRAAIPLFTATIFVSSSLLFLVQPMFARLVLPRLGGSPSVWNTCMLFFQTMLLAGYLYADLATRSLGARRQARWHAVLLLLPIAFLPLTVGAAQPPASANPVWWLLGTMTARLGLPFFVISASAPLLQRWFATLPVPSARDPYFLYAASNAGSMLALVAYPFVVEPSVGVVGQTRFWSAGYVALIVLFVGCATLIRRYGQDLQPQTADAIAAKAVSVRTRVAWVVFSAVPSSLMLGVTTHISTDVAAVPLLWVLPLALYLATFILAFSPTTILSHKWLVRCLPALVLASLLTNFLNVLAWRSIALHLGTFFVAALVCHRELARRRPDVRHLTEYYIWLSVGGMLGGVFNTLIAPNIFTRVFEYPLALAAVALVRPSPGFRRSEPESYAVLVGLPAIVFMLSAALWALGLIDAKVGVQPLLLTFVFLLAVAYMFANRAGAFGTTAFIIVAMMAFLRPPSFGTVLFAGRSFFGVHRVIDAPDHSYHVLQHGVTTHGRQQTAALTRCEQTGYYHPLGPIGQLFGATPQGFENVAVIGLGSGALTCYARPGDGWTFYEIDPLVERVARNTQYFTYLANSPTRVRVVLGDGRLTLQKAQPGSLNLVVVDAFSSDAIPVHLLTWEAIALYFSKLAQDGVLALHISNAYLNLEPVIGALAREQHLFALANLDTVIPDVDKRVGRLPSHWVVLARAPQPLAGLLHRPGWRSPELKDNAAAWTDDYSNILHILKFY